MVLTKSQTILEQVMTGTSIDKTLTFVADLVGLTRGTVIRIVDAGLPMMAREADEDPYVFKSLFAQSMKAIPERTSEYYARLSNDSTLQQAIGAEFRNIFGTTTDEVNLEAARRADVTEAQASQVLAVTMPAVVKAVGLLNTQRNEMGFGRLLRSLKA